MSMAWRPNLSEIPERPGVYHFRSARGAILYIGKALNLRRRIASYVQRRAGQPAKLRRMLARARGVTIEETGSELEALLLESRLLKRETPPFNQLSTRYAALPFVKLTLAEPFPHLLLTRDFAADGSLYLGPFPRYDIAEAVLMTLQRLFPLRTCEGPIWPGVSPPPCVAFHVRKCAAPCLSPAYAARYQPHVAEMLTLLARGREAILHRLLVERQRAVEAMKFERAGHLHALFAAFDEATLGRPLALMPVTQRNLAVCFEAPQPRACEVYFIRHGLFAGRVILPEPSPPLERLQAALTRGYSIEHRRGATGSEAVVDELRIVAGWLHRTRRRARWVYLDAQESPTENRTL
ncbi:MAG TPA: GIY-YIG nuclease family protein [Alphaproteobacteria bacterium]|nr:GIY-YIG nuclease family protein [Alphaproteobacteria bacterium]